MTLPVLVINRAADDDRLDRFRQSAERFRIGFQVISALDGHDADFPFAEYADLIGDAFWGEPEIKPGAIGCFLSHRLAWQTLLDAGHERALVCEDDAVFHVGLGEIDEIASGADVVFANSRMSAWAQAAGYAAATPLPVVVSTLAALGGARALSLKAAPGADAYVLTASGARRLLEITARQGIVCGVDWAMLRAALPGVDDQMAQSFQELELLRDLATSPPVAAMVLTKPLAGQADGMPSTIRHRVTVPIASLGLPR
ncbi:MAG: glycosyltransferase family 25 protein [Pseudomonadota bacterium]